MRVIRMAGMGAWLLLAATAQAQETFFLKIVAINPSREQEQQAVVKAYLPNEIKPEDVIDPADLEVVYDAQQSAYYLYGEYNLRPGETLEREVEVKDIWRIQDEELSSLRSETAQTVTLLEGTDFRDRAAFLQEVIETKLNKIIDRQKVPAVSPQRHISDHRENLKLLEAVKADLQVARSLLAQAKPKGPSIAVWRLFIAIVAFLGLLGAAFYLLWQRQLKTITTPTFGQESTPESQPPEGRYREPRKDKPVQPEDIEKIIGEDS